MGISGGTPSRARNQPVLLRHRVIEALTGVDAAPVTLVHGPPGLGKSVLLDQAVELLGAADVRRLDSSDLPADGARPAGTEAAVVVADDVPGLDDAFPALRAAHEPETRLIVATRTLPGWATAQRVLAGDIRLIGTQDLLFDSDEIRQLGVLLDVPLSADDVAQVGRLTDGWPALVVAALRSRRPGGALSDRQLRDLTDRFIRIEVLGELSPGERELLSVAAAAPRFDAAVLALLLDEATPAGRLTAPAGVIDRWAAEGWLIHASETHWRLPEPIRRSLLADLEVRQPGRRVDLLTEAVRILVARGRTGDALPLVVDSSLDKVTAGGVVRASWEPAVARGQFSDLLPAVSTLPDDILAGDPVLLLLAAVSALAPPPDLATFAHRVAQADAQVDQTRLSATLLTIRSFQMVLGRARGDSAAAGAAEQSARRLIEAATESDRRTLTDRLIYFDWQSGANRLADGDLEQAEALLGAAATAARHAGTAWHEANCEALRSYTSVLRGDLAAAAHQLRSATELAERNGWTRNQFTDHVHITRGLLELEAGRTSGVPAILHEAQRRLERDAVPPAARLATAWAVLAMLRRDETAAGHAELLCGDDYASNRLPLNRMLASIARSVALLARDDPKAALAELDRAVAPPGHQAALAAARARAHLAALDPLAADRELTAVDPAAGALPLTLLGDLHALRAEIALQRGADPQSHVHQLLAVLERTGSRRPVLMLPALREAMIGGSIDGPPDALVTELAALHRANTGSLPALSERESQVLAALVGPETLSDIAKGLFVSVNTLKTTTRSIYRKLGVADRYEAVRVARALALLPPN